jgi:hypothetical protein
MIVETATTIIGSGKIDEVFSRRIITKAQIKTTETNTTTSVYPSQVVERRRILLISARTRIYS